MKRESGVKKTATKARSENGQSRKGLSTVKKTTAGNGLQKVYLKSTDTCRTTFRLPGAAAAGAERVCVVGDFNDWNCSATPMKRARNGDYTVRLDLEKGREYQFRYLINGSKWENDWNADRYVQNPLGNGDNSVVIT